MTTALGCLAPYRPGQLPQPSREVKIRNGESRDGKVEGKRVSERENRILSLLRNAWQRGFLPCDKKEICLQISLLAQRVEREENRGGGRRTEEEKEGSGWDGGGAEVYRRAL